MQTTGNLGLKKPEGTDIVDIADLNGNMDILDNAVTGKVDKVSGKQLSTSDYTAAEKTKLAGVAAGANNYAHPNHTGDVTSNGDGVTAISAGVIVNADVNAAAGIDASKIGTGVVSNAEFGYLDGVTSGIQGQLNGKETPAGAQAKADAALAVVKADYVRQPGYATTSGTATAYIAALTPAPTTTPDGFGITIVPHVTNSANPTLSVNGLAATPLKDQKGVAFAAGKLLVGKPYTFRKVGTDFLVASGGGGEYGTATAADVLAGKTIGTENGVYTGTIPLRTMTNGVSGTGHHTATESSIGAYTSGDPQNYVYVRPNPNMGRVAYEGDTWVRAAAPDLLPQNFLQGKTVLGMAGAIVQRGTHTPVSSTAWNGSEMYVRFPVGAYLQYDSVGEPQLVMSAAQARADGNIQAGNIRAGVWVYGVVGNLQPRQYASGTMSPQSGALYQVTGLSFRPTVVTVFNLNQYGYQYMLNLATPAGVVRRMNRMDYNGSSGEYAIDGAMLDNGFQFTSIYSQINIYNYTWEAWG